MRSTEGTSRSRTTPVAAATCWIAAGVVYVATEAITALAFPGYSYATNYISDLGIPQVETFGGRAIDSPLHLVMNTGFVLHGVLFVAAAMLATRARGMAHRRLFLALAVTHGVGIVLVGVVHGGQVNADSGLGVVHGVGAAMAIVGGNLTAIVAGLAARRSDRLRRLGTVCVTLGLVGVVGAVALVVDSGSTSIDLLPDGVWERLAVYTITAFELLLGAVTLVRVLRSRPDTVLAVLGAAKPPRHGRGPVP